MVPVKELLLGVPLVCWLGWAFWAPLPSDRIDRLCLPTEWVSNFATSATALASDKYTETSNQWGAKFTYSCKYAIWRLIYQDDYNKAVASGLVKDGVPTGQQPNYKDPLQVSPHAVERAIAISPPTKPVEKADGK